MTELAQPRAPRSGRGPRRLSRAQAVGELAERWRDGDHVTAIGPTGRGKSTLIGQLVPACRFDRVVILTPKGPDRAYRQLRVVTRRWPPRRPWRDQLAAISGGEDRHARRPQVWRIELPWVPGLPDLADHVAVYREVLRSALRRPQEPADTLAIVLDDSRVISDTAYMGLGPLVVGNMMLARSKRVSVVNNYQAPRWVPREGLDQGTQIIMWKNRDRDVMRRLAEVGDLDLDQIRAGLDGLEYHQALWIDGRTDDLFVIGQ